MNPHHATAPALLCDAMLAHLARWLRAAGYDAATVQPQSDDRAVIAQARSEGRILLTCDRRLRGRDVEVVHLPMAPLEEQAAVLARRLGLDWQYAPLSRCLVDNTPLEPLPEDALSRLPEPARRLGGPFMRCRACGRLFWPGSHVRRMQVQLQRFAAASTGRGRQTQPCVAPAQARHTAPD